MATHPIPRPAPDPSGDTAAWAATDPGRLDLETQPDTLPDALHDGLLFEADADDVANRTHPLETTPDMPPHEHDFTNLVNELSRLVMAEEVPVPRAFFAIFVVQRGDALQFVRVE